ncbi:MAG TPA: GFA family protein, partial [Mycoplana sp.]|nr:GFA family protein [Mycoplana sp.]
FDDPSCVAPTIQFGTEAKIAFVDRLHTLPGHTTEEDAEEAPFVLEIVSHQHPDHDTVTWPPEERA